ncbi:acyltransferase family protein [Arcanobacterium buesumense]|uniref:Acyltransferase n=1 Tax=Arcanobacterium buesumense TaxID=2722751 RepID=A0A6H2ENC6_9ACTO|nr:acyltransferase family protein [Arcanobacterium buesumense]QJC22552.1 acyltransferase [Arcanobacterium buesumense]
MNVFLLALVLVSLIGLRIYARPDVDSYISHAHTTQINGVFILIVFYAHVRTYIPLDPAADGWMYGLATGLGQLMVALFLFYSGFGVQESITRKPGYVDSIPVKRLAVTWVNFAVAVSVYAVLSLLTDRDISVSQFLLALVGWTSVGNSAWYIFAILVLYGLTFVVHRLLSDVARVRPGVAVAAMFAAGLLFGAVMLWAKGASAAYTFNTVLCYPLGMAWSVFRAPVEARLRGPRSRLWWLVFLVSTTAIFVALKNVAGAHYLVFQLAALAYCAVAMLVSMVVHLNSPILAWCGRNLFWIYVLQRLPMLTLTYAGWAEYRYLFVVVSFVVTIALTAVFSRLMAPVQRRIVSRWA